MPSEAYFTSAAPTLSEGQMNHLRVDQNGQLIVTATTTPGATTSAGDALPNPTAVGQVVNYSEFWNGSVWERARSSVESPETGSGGFLGVLPRCVYSSAGQTATDGQTVNLQANSHGALKIQDSAWEEATLTLSAASPTSAGTVVSTSATGTASWRNIKVEVTLTGQTSGGASIGGTLDAYVQCGASWTDWVHFAQVAASAAPVTYTYVPALNDSITTVGSGTSPALAAGTGAGGHPGGQVRLLFVAGSGTSASGAQVARVVGVRPVA
jgi:hypothetical protein